MARDDKSNVYLRLGTVSCGPGHLLVGEALIIAGRTFS
jgi:hypothetical protein